MSTDVNAATRLPFIDALRGIAAAGVCIAHCASYGIAHLDRGLAPAWAKSLLDRGTLGVPMFFVISGFVMRYSLLGKPTGLHAFGRFVLRRQLRLDPPYWASMAFAVVVFAVLANFAGDVHELPSAGSLLAHVTYTQSVFGVPHIQAVYWTLCIEIQFYFLLFSLVAVSRSLGDRVAATAFPLLILSLAIFDDPWRASGPWYGRSDASVVPTFAMFYLGIASCEAFYVRRSGPWFSLGCAAVAVRLTISWNEYLAAALVTAALVSAFRTRAAGPVARYFGRISYSLYLFHGPTAWIVALALRRMASPTASWQWASLALGFAACIAVATLGYYGVERPSVTLSRRAFRTNAPTPR